MEVCYEMFNGSIYFSDDMKKAFYISTGIDSDTNYGMYVKWLNSKFGVSIKRYFKPTVEELILHDYKIKAVSLYRRINKCNLPEAIEAVENMMDNMSMVTD